MAEPVVLVVGAAGGVGQALVRSIATSYQLVLAGRTKDSVADLAAEVDAGYVVLDAADVKAVEDVVEQVVADHGRLDGIVNLAGSLLLKPAHLTTPDEWQQTVADNLTSAFAVVRAAAKAMRGDGGSIVLMSSAAGRLGLPNHEAIAAVKAGIEGLVRSAAATYGARGVRVNAVAPGMTRTPLTEKLTSNEAQLEASRAMHVLGRIGEPEDVASAIAWLLDPANDWFTGQVIGVDGGLGSVRTRVRG